MDEALVTEVFPTFKAAIRSVGTACTLAGVGVYLHRRGFVAGDGKKTLALIAQQVTIPLLLFTKIIFCNQDWSSEPCPDITKSLEDVWLLLVWPIYVVTWGMLVGWLAARLSNAPRHQIRAVLVSCTFSNCTGLPITLLQVVHANFPSTSDLGRIDPTLFLSVYLLIYPILQWGIGGWLLAPEVEDDDDDDADDAIVAYEHDEEDKRAEQEEDGDEMMSPPTSLRMLSLSNLGFGSGATEGQGHHHQSIASIAHNVLNNSYTAGLYKYSRRGINETDASMYISNVDLTQWTPETPAAVGEDNADTAAAAAGAGSYFPSEDYANDDDDDDERPGTSSNQQQVQPLINKDGPIPSVTTTTTQAPRNSFATERSPLLSPNSLVVSSTRTTTSAAAAGPPPKMQYEEENLSETVSEIFTRCLQPPVVGAMLGILVAATPLRGIFVDLKNRSSNAPLQWFFDGLYAVGQAAVPLNMMILGSNVSSSLGSKNSHMSPDMFSSATMMAIVVGKMVVMPIIGVLSACVLKYYFLEIPDSIEGSFYLVVMIVFITPTANNVMVMVELSGAGVKEGMARVIMLQYAVAPIILCLTMSVVVGIASGWS